VAHHASGNVGPPGFPGDAAGSDSDGHSMDLHQL